MENQISELVLHIGSFDLELPQSILVWFGLCIGFTIFFIVAGKKIEKADPSKAPKGIVYISKVPSRIFNHVES